MIGLIRIRYEGIAGSPKELRAIFKQVWEEVGIKWHREMRPKHFTRAGATEYGYERRTRRYTQRKLKRFGHTDPLVWTGETQRVSRIRDVRATSKGVRIVMNMPRLNRLGRKGPPLLAEMTRVSDRERREIEAFMQRRIDELIQQNRSRREVVLAA